LRLAIFGGSFDPVHKGHVLSALELVDKLGLQQLRFMPGGIHVFSKAHYFSSEQRLAMLQLAIKEFPSLVIDTRETDREDISYSIDSCREIRAELGATAQLFFVIGSDLLSGLHRWHNWELLLDYVNIVVIQRAGQTVYSANTVQTLDTKVQRLFQNAQMAHNDGAEGRAKASRGEFITLELSPWPLSSTQVRQTLVALASASAEKRVTLTQALADMLDPAVYEYIIKNDLAGSQMSR